MAIKKLLDIILTSLNDGKAIDIDLFDVKKITSMSDYILIASGNSSRQVNALADRLIQTVKENKFETLGVEGKAEGEWVLVDLGDIIVHIMHPNSREYYQLEKLIFHRKLQSKKLAVLWKPLQIMLEDRLTLLFLKYHIH